MSEADLPAHDSRSRERLVRRAEYPLALLGLVVGSGAVLLLSGREWQTVLTPRPRPFADDVLGLSGRTIDNAPTALALVALAGVVAVLATKGVVRQAVGVLLALAGLLLLWRCAGALATIGISRARELVAEKHSQVVSAGSYPPHVSSHAGWGLLSIAASVLVLAAGLLIALRSRRWSEMSAKYDRPATAKDIDPEQARARADASLWTALERGEDPTAHDPRDIA